MFVAALIGSAFATPCTLPTNPFATTCGTGSVVDGETCLLKCKKYYVPTTNGIYTCTTGTLSPTRIACVPDQRFARMFPWRASKCAILQEDTGFAARGQAAVATGVITLQTTSAGFWGEWQFKPVRTFGRHQPIEVSFEYKLEGTAVGLGSNGIYLVVSSSSASIQTQVDPAVGTGALLAIELDLDATDSYDTGSVSASAEFSTPHIALLYDSIDHAATSQASLVPLAVAHAFTWSMSAYKAVSVVLKPVQSSSSVLVELWHDGMLISRDTVTQASSVNAKLIQMIDQPRRLAVSMYGDADVTDNGLVKIQNAKFCGAELPTMWHKFFVPATPPRNRLCIVTESFGNPEPTLPGLWRPSGCPAGVMLWPQAPRSNPLTIAIPAPPVPVAVPEPAPV